MIHLPNTKDVAAMKRWLQKQCPAIEFDFEVVETADDIADIVYLINEALADPTVEFIEAVGIDWISFRLTQEEVERRRVEDAENMLGS